jgi:deoxyadenosine/deoxycytidine kinase
MYKLQFNSIPKPDIIIEVSAETKTILERLEKR